MARKRGRPAIKSGEESVSINVREPKSEYDRIWHIANREGVTVPEVLRRGGWRSDSSLSDRVMLLEKKVFTPPITSTFDFDRMRLSIRRKLLDLAE